MRILLSCFFAIFILLLGACANSQYRFEYQTKQVNKVWPAEPEKPRIRYLGIIYGDQNFRKIEGSEGFFRQGLSWFGNLLFGDDAPRRLYRPQSGAMDNEKNRLYVTDVGSKSVFVFDFAKGSLDIWEGADNNTAFIAPIAICLLGQDEIFVSDAQLGRVIKFNGQGETLASIGDEYLSRPTGLTCDKASGKIYVADSHDHKIHVFSANGKWLYEFGKKGKRRGELNSPTHLLFANEKLYVSDTLNARVQVFDASGQWLSGFGKRGMFVGNLPRPKGVAVDSDEHIYVIESYYDHLLIFDKSGRGLLPIGGSGAEPGQFNLPAGVWIDQNDVIYVADMFNSRVMVFEYLH